MIHRHPRGFSIVEVLLVLGLLVVFAAAMFAIYPQVRSSNAVATEQTRLLRTVSVLKALYFSRGNYSGLTTDTANQAKAFASEANEGNYAPGQLIAHVWGGSVTVGEFPTDPKRMFVDYEDVPAEACLRFVSGSSKNFESVWVNGTTVWQRSGGSAPDVGVIAAACGEEPAMATVRFVTE